MHLVCEERNIPKEKGGLCGALFQTVSMDAPIRIMIVSDSIHCARALRLREAFSPLQ